MSCGQRARLVELGPEGLGDHLDQCPHCQADVERIDEAMADLWDDLEDFLDAEPPLVVGPLPPVPEPANEPARTPWPAIGLAVAVAAALMLVVWPAVSPSLEALTEPAAAELDPLEAGDEEEKATPPEAPREPDIGPQVAPVEEPVGSPGDDGVAEAVRPPVGTRVAPRPPDDAPAVEDDCAGGWWTWSSADDACLTSLLGRTDGELAVAVARLVGGESLGRRDVRVLADEVSRRSGQGDHDGAVGVGFRLLEAHADTRTLRTVTLAAREWMSSTADLDLRERRRLQALALADRWVALAPAGNAAARSVRDSLVRSVDERVPCPPLLGSEDDGGVPSVRCPYDALTDVERGAWIVKRFAVTPSLGVSQVRTIRQHERMDATLAAELVRTLPAEHLHRLVPELGAVPGARTDASWVSVWRPLAVRLQERIEHPRQRPDPAEVREAYEVVRIWASLAPDDPAAQQLAERVRK